MEVKPLHRGQSFQGLGTSMDKVFLINGEEVKATNFNLDKETLSFQLGAEKFEFLVVSDSVIAHGTQRFSIAKGSANSDGESIVMAMGREAIMSSGTKVKKKAQQAGSLVSPMPGKIFKILKEKGSVVKKGDPILIMEAMKMEHSIRADKDGTVKNILFKVGELVQGGVVLAEVDA